MLIKSWKDIGITQEDFQRLWDLPAGKFKRRIEALTKSKTKETFFPEVTMQITKVSTQTVTLKGRSEDDVKSKFLQRDNPFEGAEIKEYVKYTRIY